MHYDSCIFVDLTTAFDTVDRNLLISKLEKCGVIRENLNIFKSYLSNRNQSLFVNYCFRNFNVSEL